MKRRLHRIAEDLRDVQGRRRWEWLHIGHGVRDAETLLWAHAELQRQYPENKGDSNE